MRFFSHGVIFMRSLYLDIRNKLIRALLILIIAVTCADILYFAFLFFTGSLGVPPLLYILMHVAPPLVIDLLAYRIAVYANDFANISDSKKNYTLSFVFGTVLGMTGIFHNEYLILWVLPVSAVLVCAVFTNRRLIRILAVYAAVLAGLAWLYASLTDTAGIFVYAQNLVIVLLIDFAAFAISRMMMDFMTGMRTIQKDLYNQSLDYKEKLDVDYLTGVSSRSHMTKEAQKRLYRASQFNPVSVAIIDIDNFKSINDTFGHENGDVVLKELGHLLTTQLKDDVEVGRYGGEEFVIIFEGVSTGMHQIRLDRVRQLFSEIRYDFTDRRITFSGGIKSVIDPAEFAPTLQKADEALYISKNNGKNRITPAA